MEAKTTGFAYGLDTGGKEKERNPEDSMVSYMKNG